MGAVEAGKSADIIAVNGDPLADISAMERVVFVMKGGEIVKPNPGASRKNRDVPLVHPFKKIGTSPSFTRLKVGSLSESAL